ncbi:hypothetical protein ACA910_005464 [Epithemia clementina (nom. ined.)]
MKSPPLSKEETTSVAQSSAQESTSSKSPSVAVSQIQAEPSSSKNLGEAASLEPAGAPKSPLYDLQIDLPTQMDKGGMTPLHLVCRDASTFNVQEVKAAIQDAPWLLRRRNLDGSTPLHVLCSNNPALSPVELLVENWESYILIENMYGWLPIHCACARRASLEVVEFLAKKDEQMVESSSRTVLRETYGQNNNVFHLACDNAMPNDGSDANLRPSHDPSLRVVQFLVGLARELALRKNSTGDLPIDMARRAKAFDIVKFLKIEFSELVDSHEKKKESKTNLTEYVDIEYMRASISQLHTNGDVAVSDHVWTSTREKLDELGSAVAVSCETAKDASGIAMSMAHEWVNFQPERRVVICIDASNKTTLLRDYNVVIRSFLKTQLPTSGGDLFEDEKDAADQLLEILDSIPATAQFHWLVLFQNCPDKTPVEMWFFSNNSYWWNSRASFLFAISKDGAANLARGLDGIWVVDGFTGDGIWVVDGVTGQSQLLSSTA